MLCAVITDFGQCAENVSPRAHTALRLSGCSIGIHAQFRTFTKPLDRHSSQFQAAGEENWKWNAIRSFFFLLPLTRAFDERFRIFRRSAPQDLCR
jgi:hypothetical protein